MIGEFESFSGNFSGPVLETIFNVSGKTFAGIKLSLKNLSYQAFAEFERKKVGLSGKISNRVVEPALYIGKKNILKRVYKLGISKLFFICGFWDENFQPIRETLIGGVRIALYVFKGAIGRNMFLEENNLSFSWALFGNLWTSWGKSFGRIGRTIDYVSTKRCSKKLFFVIYVLSKTSKNELLYLLTFSKSFTGRLRKSAFYVSSETFWGKTRSWMKRFFQGSFGAWSGYCRPFRDTLQHGRQNCTIFFQIVMKRVFKFWSSKLFVVCQFWDEKLQPPT